MKKYKAKQKKPVFVANAVKQKTTRQVFVTPGISCGTLLSRTEVLCGRIYG